MPVRSAEQVLTSTASLMAAETYQQVARTVSGEYLRVARVGRPVLDRCPGLDPQRRPFGLARLGRVHTDAGQVGAEALPEPLAHLGGQRPALARKRRRRGAH